MPLKPLPAALLVMLTGRGLGAIQEQPMALSLHSAPLSWSRRGAPADFEVLGTNPLPSGAEISVEFGTLGVPVRSVKAILREGHYHVLAAPVPPGNPPHPLRLRFEAVFETVTLCDNMDDRKIRIGARELDLSQVRELRRKGEVAAATLTHFDPARQAYETVTGRVTGLPSLHSIANEVRPSLAMADHLKIGAYESAAARVPYRITLSAGGKVVATSPGVLVLEDGPAAVDLNESSPELTRRTIPENPHTSRYDSFHIENFIDPARDVLKGSWKKLDRGLQSSAEPEGWCEVPAVPRGNYLLHFRITPQETAKGELILHLPVAESETLIHLDGARGYMTIEPFRGREESQNRPTPIHTFNAGEKWDIWASVTYFGRQAAVNIDINDGIYAEWDGSLENIPVAQGVPVARDHIGLGHHNLAMEIEIIGLRTKGGAWEMSRELPVALGHDPKILAGRWTFTTPATSERYPGWVSTSPARLIGAPEPGVGKGIVGVHAMKVGGETSAGLRVQEGDTTNLGSHPQRTLCLWFRADAPAAPGQRQYLYEEGGAETGLALYLEDGALWAGGWQVATKWAGTWLQAPGIAPGKWYHVALTTNGTAADTSQGMRLYLNGAPVATGPCETLAPHEAIAIGTVLGTTRASPKSPAASADHQFAGTLDEVEVFNAELTPATLKILAGGRYSVEKAR